ncbi:unnamed protein product [Diatraea saccharalis]|uniref:NWD2 C-terminal beta-propeller domain-containing protein n=1 Tax=Diatraea saccharalis TaxID=40085 RepID=A0A9N9RH14_9NEOP|nr:unnamed protein product [Diatraea saccharalis]
MEGTKQLRATVIWLFKAGKKPMQIFRELKSFQIFRKLKNFPAYSRRKVHFLNDHLRKLRCDRCPLLLRRHDARKILFTDEKIFTDEEKFNRQNNKCALKVARISQLLHAMYRALIIRLAKSTQAWLRENVPAFITTDKWRCSSSYFNLLDYSLWIESKLRAWVGPNLIPIKNSGIKDMQSIVALPHKPLWVAVVGNDKAGILDIKTKRHVRVVPRWNGASTRDGKVGLCAPTRGGLELIELKRGATVQQLITRAAEGVFSIITMFSSTDQYAFYYHSGRKSLRVFRTIDGKAIAEYRAPAEVTGVASAHGGKAVAIASQDGCLTVLNIVDPHE